MLFAARGPANGIWKLLVGEILHHESDRPGCEGPLRKHRVLLHRHNHDLGLRRTLPQLPDCFAAGPVRHAKVEHEHVRLAAADVAGDRCDVDGFGNYLDVVLAVEQQPQTAAHQRMVVSKDHADRALLGLGGSGVTQRGRQS